MTKVALFGCGNFGKVHKETMEGLGHEVYVVDKLNATDPALRCDPLENPDVFGRIEDATHWDIVTQHSTHAPLIEEGLKRGKVIIVENPSTPSLEETMRLVKTYPDAPVGVDYVEMANPVVLAAQEFCKKTGFKPIRTKNARVKDLEPHLLGYRITMDDIIHDFSEISSIRSAAGLEGRQRVKSARMETWKDATKGVKISSQDPHAAAKRHGYAATTDGRAWIDAIWDDGMESVYFGSFVEFGQPDLRVFMLYGLCDGGPMLLYGNTLRGNSMAAIIRGNLEKFEKEYFSVQDIARSGHLVYGLPIR